MNKKIVANALKLRKQLMKAVRDANRSLIFAHESAIQMAESNYSNARTMISQACHRKTRADASVLKVKSDLMYEFGCTDDIDEFYLGRIK